MIDLTQVSLSPVPPKAVGFYMCYHPSVGCHIIRISIHPDDKVLVIEQCGSACIFELPSEIEEGFFYSEVLELPSKVRPKT